MSLFWLLNQELLEIINYRGYTIKFKKKFLVANTYMLFTEQEKNMSLNMKIKLLKAILKRKTKNGRNYLKIYFKNIKFQPNK